MKWSRWLTVLFVACLALFQANSVSAKEHKRPPAGPLITIYAPHSEQFELALDEVELDWSGDQTEAAPAASAISAPGAVLEASTARRATFRLTGTNDAGDLLPVTKALSGANPGAEVHLVLYEPGLPKSDATRRLLTREVGLLLEAGGDPGSVLAGLPAGVIRSVAGVPDGYVVETVDPIAALSLADALRQRPGVRSAYPLLKRLRFPR